MTADTISTQTAVEVTDTRGKEGIAVARLTYTSQDPLAMSITIITSQGPVVWTFAHELLKQGTLEVAGSGSVRIWPEPGGINGPHIALTLISQGQRAQIRIPQHAVETFLEQLDSIADDRHVQAHIDAIIDTLVT